MRSCNEIIIMRSTISSHFEVLTPPLPLAGAAVDDDDDDDNDEHRMFWGVVSLKIYQNENYFCYNWEFHFKHFSRRYFVATDWGREAFAKCFVSFIKWQTLNYKCFDREWEHQSEREREWKRHFAHKIMNKHTNKISSILHTLSLHSAHTLNVINSLSLPSISSLIGSVFCVHFKIGHRKFNGEKQKQKKKWKKNQHRNIYTQQNIKPKLQKEDKHYYCPQIPVFCTLQPVFGIHSTFYIAHYCLTFRSPTSPSHTAVRTNECINTSKTLQFSLFFSVLLVPFFLERQKCGKTNWALA